MKKKYIRYINLVLCALILVGCTDQIGQTQIIRVEDKIYEKNDIQEFEMKNQQVQTVNVVFEYTIINERNASVAKAEKLAKEEAERKAKEEAERLAREEAERLAREEAERLAEEERKKQEELEKQETQKETSSNNTVSVNKGNSVDFNKIQYRGLFMSNDLSYIKVNDLDEHLQEYVNRIMDLVKNSSEDVVNLDFGWNNYEEYDKVRSAINNTYFEYTWDLDISYSSIGGISVKLNVSNSRKNYNENKEIESFIAKATKSVVYNGMSERDAVIAINNYICRHITYNDNYIGLYNACVSGKGICGGYAAMFNAMCRYAGIECKEVGGYSLRGIAHAWNKVKIGSTWYYVDPTWNDDTDNEYLLSEYLWSNHIEN